MSSPTGDSPLFYEQHLSQHQDLNQGTIYAQINRHSSDLPIVTVSSCNCESAYGPCNCPSCEQKLGLSLGDPSQMDDHYGYTLPPPQIPNTSISDDDLINEISSVTSNDLISSPGININRISNGHGVDALAQRRMKMSEAARIRYHSLTTEEKRALNERRIMMRKRKKQKDREMEELERILRATNDITDDLVPVEDPEELVERRNKLNEARIRYQSMSLEERKAFTLKRRLKQLGLPENTDPNSETVKRKIAEINARKAAAARARYHRMTPEERRIYNRRRTDSFRYRRRRLDEEKLLATPAGQINAEELERAQNIMLRNAKRAEQARMRYQRKQQEKLPAGLRRVRKPPKPIVEENNNSNNNNNPNVVELTTDSILDSIERDVTRRTFEARQALVRKNRQESPNKRIEVPVLYKDSKPSVSQLVQPAPMIQKIVQQQSIPTTSGAHSAPIIQYVQVPAGHNGFILADNKLIPVCDPQTSQGYNLNQIQPKIEPAYITPNQQIIIQYDPQQPLASQVQQQLQRIEIVQPSGHVGHLDSAGHQIIYTTPSQTHQQQPQYVIQVPQQDLVSGSPRTTAIQQRNFAPVNRAGDNDVDERILLQRARRAERARRRYHEMSVEARHEFNAKRAQSLKMARARDEELCRQGDEYDAKGVEPNPELKVAIEQARARRSKRAEAARIKYQKMTQEQRRVHNAMRDAQRRQRKLEIEIVGK